MNLLTNKELKERIIAIDEMLYKLKQNKKYQNYTLINYGVSKSSLKILEKRIKYLITTKAKLRILRQTSLNLESKYYNIIEFLESLFYDSYFEIDVNNMIIYYNNESYDDKKINYIKELLIEKFDYCNNVEFKYKEIR